jgi:hypothetical protein
MSPIERIRGLDPTRHRSHALHDLERDWPETNCYVDLWIEILGALGLQVEAGLGFLVESELEGDQWTFFKPPHGELEDFYGIRVVELALWAPLIEHVQQQLGLGRLPLVEVDAYHLPDTCGTDYGSEHTKTTVAITGVDQSARRMTYFHNRGLHAVEGDDFDALLMKPFDGDRLPPYCELAKLDRARALSPDALRRLARESLRVHLSRRPADNPVAAYGEVFAEHMTRVFQGGLDLYHAYSFASVRQLGANAELLAAHARWLDDGAAGPAAGAADRFTSLSATAKALILKGARMAARGRMRDVQDNFAAMAEDWQQGMDGLTAWVG